jgi:hypothetical protein
MNCIDHRLWILLILISLPPSLQATEPKPIVNSGLATAVGTTGMTVNGQVHPHGRYTRYYFEYGLTTDYGNQTPIRDLPPRLAAYYQENWDHGYGGWYKRDGPMEYHDQGGQPGGFVRYCSPTSDDHNHDDGIGTLHLASYVYTGPLSAPELKDLILFLSAGDPDLRGAKVSLSVRGRDWVANGSELLWWTQSQSNIEVGTNPGWKRANWAYTGYLLTDLLKTGRWEKAEYRLEHNSEHWTFGGNHLQLPNRLNYPYWPIDQSQGHVNCDFFHLLAFVDPENPPQGAIDFDEFQLVYRNKSLVFSSNGGHLTAAPRSDSDPATLTDGWRHGPHRMWQSDENPKEPLEFIYHFDQPVMINAVQLHQNPEWPTKDIELEAFDGNTYTPLCRSQLPQQGMPNANFAFIVKRGLATEAHALKVRILSGYRKARWGLGEIEVFGSGATMLPDDALYQVNTDIMNLRPGKAYHYRLVADSNGQNRYGSDRTFTVPRDAKPRVRTGLSSRITSTTAKLNGRLNPLGQPATFYFEYGTAPGYGKRSPSFYGGLQLVPRTAFVNLSNLQPGTRYHYRLVAENDAGRSHGADAAFETLSE